MRKDHKSLLSILFMIFLLGSISKIKLSDGLGLNVPGIESWTDSKSLDEYSENEPFGPMEEEEMVGLSPVGWWKLEEDPSAGTATDDGSGGNDGTVNNMEAEDEVAAKVNNGYNFDGSNEYIDCGDVNDFERTDTFSLECWFKGTLDGPLISKLFDGGHPYYDGYTLDIGPNDLIFRMHDDDDVTFEVFGTHGMSSSSLHHIVVTYDGTSKGSGVKMYIDGQPISMTINIAGTLTGSTITTGNLYFARKINDPNGLSNYLTGIMDEIVIYDEAISEEDVRARYLGGLGNATMDTCTYDISTLSNILKLEIHYMTLDEGIPFAILQVEDNWIPADWYINFTDKYYDSGGQSDTTIFKGYVMVGKTKRDDASGLKTFYLTHFCTEELGWKPSGTYGIAGDSWGDILGDIITDDSHSNITAGTLTDTTAIGALTLNGQSRTFLALIREAAELEGYVPYLTPAGALNFRAPTTSLGLTWTDANCRWLGSTPAGPRPNRVYAQGIGITCTGGFKNATDTSFQTKYGVIRVYRFKAISDQTFLDNWAQGYIDNLAANQYIITVSADLSSQGLLQVGQTVNYASAQMVLTADDYLVKSIVYDALTMHGRGIKLSLGMGFKAQPTVKEQIDESVEYTTSLTEGAVYMCRINTDTYTGNGNSNRQITGFGFTPKAVYITNETDGYYPYMVSDTMTAWVCDELYQAGSLTDAIKIIADGIELNNNRGDDHFNRNAIVYHYVAWG